MRALVQPGPVSAERIEALRGRCTRFDFRIESGMSLADAIGRPLIEAGVRAATLRFAGAELEPFRYVMPGPPDGAAHVAYFSAVQAPAGPVRVEIANVTFGYADGRTLLHCHAAWQEREAGRRGGHILLDESIVVAPAAVAAWTFVDIGYRTALDPETNFSLLRPKRIDGGDQGQAVVARIRPNEDVCTAVETIARRHGMRDAVVHGSLAASLVRGLPMGAPWRVPRRKCWFAAARCATGWRRSTWWWWTCVVRSTKAVWSVGRILCASRSIWCWKRLRQGNAPAAGTEYPSLAQRGREVRPVRRFGTR
jgi:predicted DNA-binding protein with PD1-like motif